MLNNIYQFFSLRPLRLPVVGLLLTVGIVGEHTKPVFSLQRETVPTSTAIVQARQHSSRATTLTQLRGTNAIAYQKSAKETVTTPRANFPKQDGVYLYGQSPQPDQMGQGYIVFEKRQGTVKGALYMPSSEFSCFQGTLDKSGELAMTVKSLPALGEPTEVATSNRLPRVTDDEPTSYAYSVALQDYHQLKSISANDRRILQMCNQPGE